MSKILCFSHVPLFICFLIMLVCCENKSSHNTATAPEWSTDFEAGAASNLYYRKDGSIGFSIPEEPGGSQYAWFYFKVINVGKSPLRFTLENAAQAHQTGWRWKITKPVFSIDGRTWVKAEYTQYSFLRHWFWKRGIKLFGKPVFRFRSPVIADSLWVAYSYPYTSSNLNAFLKTIENSPNVAISVIGKSEEDRDIVRVDITGDHLQDKEKRPRIWVIGREHPGETALSYFCEGIVKALLDSAAGDLLREVFDFTLVPMLNVDGVAHGYYYHNASGVNLARDWVEFKSREARTLKDALIDDIQNRSVRLLINLHSTNDPMKGHFFLVIPKDKLKHKDAKFQKRLLLAAKNKHPQLQGHSTTSLQTMPGITGNVLYHDFGLYSFYLETNYSRGADGSTVTPEALREAGAALVRTLAEVLISE